MAYVALGGKLIELYKFHRFFHLAWINENHSKFLGADANYEFGIHAWDVAAGDLIVREAGGVVIDPAGGPLDLMSRRVLAASSIEIANDLSKLIAQYYPEPRD